MDTSSGCTVLVVAPDPKYLASAREILESDGHHVLTATAFDEALQVLQRSEPDVLVTELRLGRYNGLHLILRSRVGHPRMLGMVVTQHPDSVLRCEAERLGATYLEWPLQREELAPAVSQLFVAKQPVVAFENARLT
jgi:DNA-binding NtrC family response regulator